MHYINIVQTNSAMESFRFRWELVRKKFKKTKVSNEKIFTCYSFVYCFIFVSPKKFETSGAGVIVLSVHFFEFHIWNIGEKMISFYSLLAWNKLGVCQNLSAIYMGFENVPSDDHLKIHFCSFLVAVSLTQLNQITLLLFIYVYWDDH